MTLTVCKITTVMAMFCAMSFGTALAGGNGSTPNGRPFVEIAGQIAEVKSDINDLQIQHDDILARVEALEDADFQGQIDLLNSEILRLDLENDERVAEIEDLVLITEQNGFDIGFALSEIQRLEDEIDNLAEDQAALALDLQGQIDALADDIAFNAEGLLSAIEDVEQNFDLIQLLQTDIDVIEADIVGLATELAGKQDDIGVACPTGFYVFAVQDDGTLVCAQDQDTASATLTVATVFPSFTSLDNTSSTVRVHDECHLFVVVCIIPHTIDVTTFFRGDRFLSAFCPSGFRMTGGGFDTNSQNDIVIEDSRPSTVGSSGWTVFFDNRNSGDTSGILGRATVRCIKLT